MNRIIFGNVAVNGVVNLAVNLFVTATLAVGLIACDGQDNETAPQLAAGSAGDAELFQQNSIGNFGLSGKKKIALTYDDGPTEEVTSALLKLLRKYNIKATFFLVAKEVEGQEAVLNRMRADGHIIANHSYSHKNLKNNLYYTDINALFHQVVDSHRVIAPFMNPSHRMYFRAPYGAWTPSHAAKLNKRKAVRDYIGPVFWNIGGEISPKGTRPTSTKRINAAADWDCWSDDPKRGIYPLSVEVCAAGYWKEITAKQGGVVLMHDKSMKTVQMSARLIPALLDAGYSFVTLDDLRSLDKYE